MTGTMIDLHVAELLNSRLCHEIISPVGAIANGVELLGEDDPDFVKDAIALVEQSAKKAGQRLQFYRFAYGYASSASTGADPGDLTAGLLEGGKARLAWQVEMRGLASAWQRLACNLVVLATDTIPRGGVVTVRPSGMGIEVLAEGDTASFNAEMKAALDRTIGVGDLTSRSIHAYYVGTLALQLSAPVAVVETAPGKVSFAAVPL